MTDEPKKWVQYVGDYDEVEVRLSLDFWKVCPKGEPVELPARIVGEAPSDDHPGKGLLAQTSNWQEAQAPPPAKDEEAEANNEETKGVKARAR